MPNRGNWRGLGSGSIHCHDCSVHHSRLVARGATRGMFQEFYSAFSRSLPLQARLFPGCAFVVGADTAKRIIDPRYYEDSEVQVFTTDLPPDIVRVVCSVSCVVLGSTSDLLRWRLRFVDRFRILRSGLLFVVNKFLNARVFAHPLTSPYSPPMHAPRLRWCRLWPRFGTSGVRLSWVAVRMWRGGF